MPDKNIMKAAVLVVGNEILSGRTQDVNIRFIGERLSLRGIKLAEVRIVRDEEDAIISAVQALSAAYDYVFSTGGIGPTHDDITSACMAKAFGTACEANPEAVSALAAYYAGKGLPLDEGRLRMARIPAGATLIDNPVSGAPGFKIKNVYVMAGVPKIMQAMFLNAEPTLKHGPPMLSDTVTCSLRESEVAFEMEEIQKQHPDVEIGSYPSLASDGTPSLSLVLRAADEKKLKAATEKIAAMARRLDADTVITYQRP
jgi:molybdenum cofactor synthesis domain-containing protein